MVHDENTVDFIDDIIEVIDDTVEVADIIVDEITVNDNDSVFGERNGSDVIDDIVETTLTMLGVAAEVASVYM